MGGKQVGIVGLLGCIGLGCSTHIDTAVESAPDALVVIATRNQAPSWTIPYGEEFWRQTPGGSINVNDAIDRVSHALARRDPDRLVSRSDRSYVATFDGLGLRFASRSATPVELRLRTASIEVGRQAIYRAGEQDVAWSVLGNTAQAKLGEHLVEHHQLSDRGDELTWLLRERPASGDLEIGLSVDGLAYVDRTADGVRFGDDGVATVKIGKAVLVDARGQRWELATEASDRALFIRVNASVLENAAFPIAIDPTISAEIRPDQQNSGNFQSNPVVASNGSDFLVVWSEWPSPGPVAGIFATRVSLTGQIEDVRGILVSSSSAVGPTVASNGTDYLVAWLDDRNYDGSHPNHDIYGARILANGTIPAADIPGIPISTNPENEDWPRVASNGSGYFVAWQSLSYRISGAPVTSSGSVGATTVIWDGVFETWPAIASNGTNYLVTWTHHTSTTDPSPTGPIFVPLWSQYGALLSPGGAVVLNGIQITSESRSGQGTDSVASNGSDFLETWSGGSTSNIFGARVTGAGSVVDMNGFPMSPAGARPRSDSSVAWNGSEYLVAWVDLRDIHLINAIYGVRVLSNGTVPPADVGGFPIAVDSTIANVAPRLGAAPGTPFLIAYEAREAVTRVGIRIIGFDCGNGVLDIGETCDDGNATNGDGCSASCAVESGYTCSGTPSTCSDINECATNNGGCAQNCTNTTGSHSCSCVSGYTLDADGHSCNDVNECAVSNGGCAQVCTNSVGSFSCSCNSGYMLDADSHSCDDINECATANGGCAQVCTNTSGAHACSCGGGYTLDADSHGCDDIDECAISNGGCAQLCSNTVGSFSCSCGPGYLVAVNGSCDDINECSTNNGGCAQTCTNAVGSFSCSCGSGYQLDADGRSCSDVDECGNGTADCATDATCTNTPGSYECNCNTGFTGDGTTCVPDPGGAGCGCNSNRPGASLALALGVSCLLRRRRRT